MFVKNHKPVFAPEGAGSAATAVASAAPSEMEAVVSAILSGPQPDAKRKQGQATEATTEGTVVPPVAGDDAENEGGAGDVPDEGKGSDELPGGQADDEDFDPFDSAASTDDDTQDSDEETDAQKFTVKVDGQDEEVTLTDLMRAYSGSKAIERRLQEATENRNAVVQERNTLNQERAAFNTETQTSRETFAHGLTMLKALVAQPSVKAPDPALRVSDPTKYMLQLTDYQNDQARVAARAAQVDQALSDYNSQKEEAFTQLRQTESVKLAQVMPILTDPVKGPIVMKRIAMAAQKAGFSQQEIAMAADHRLFKMAAAAGEYYRIMENQKKQREIVAKGATQTVVSAKGASLAGPQARSKTIMANKVNKAWKTGDVADVAAVLIAPKPKVRR